MAEQRNSYKGEPSRTWLRLGFKAKDGTVLSLDLVADTGCPLAVIISPSAMERLQISAAADVESNFGDLRGGWVRLYSPELGLVEFVQAYASDSAPAAVAQDHPDFAGLVGLPVLRLGEYGGNADAFWFRHPPTS